MNGLKKTLLTTTVALVLGFAANAQAVPSLMVSDGITSVTVSDGGVGDFNPNTGEISTFYIGGVWDSSVDTGFTKPAVGSASNPLMDVLFSGISSAAGTLTISFSDTDFNGFLPDPTFNAQIGGTNSKGFFTVTYETYLGSNNQLFSTDILLTSDLYTNPSPFAGSSNGVALGINGNYSLTQIITITHSGDALTTGDAQLKAVPEPGTMMLMGSGLLGLGLWRKFKK